MIFDKKDIKFDEFYIEDIKYKIKSKYKYEGVIYINKKKYILLKCCKHISEPLIKTTKHCIKKTSKNLHCPKCLAEYKHNRIRKYDLSTIQNISNKIFDHKYKVIRVFRENTYTKNELFCNIHNKNMKSQLISNHKKGGVPCPDCKREKKREKEKLFKINKYQKVIDSGRWSGKHFIIDILYKNDSVWCVTECTEHGILKENIFDSMSLSKTCKKCKRMHNDVDFSNDIKMLIGDNYEYIDNFHDHNGLRRAQIKCKIHPEQSIISITKNCAKISKLKLFCTHCASNYKRLLYKKYDTENFIYEGKKIHNNVYLYNEELISKSFLNINSKLPTICKDHGVFYTSYYDHIINKSGHCPKCKMTSGEKSISIFLEKHKLKYIYEHSFKNCKHKGLLFFDFYIPEINTLIEFDGKQHFEISKFYGDKSNIEFEERKLRDKIKNRFAKNNNIHLIRISYLEKSQINEILYNELFKRVD